MYYAARLEKDRDMGYVVSFPDLPNVNAFGKTRAEALRMAKEALNGAMACDLEAGLAFAKPSTVPDIDRGLFPVELSVNVEVAYRLFEARRGMKKAEVARRAGITPQAYQRFETTKGSPSFDTVSRLAHAMGKELVWSLV